MSFPPCVIILANNANKRKNSNKIIVRNHRFDRHKCGTIFVSKKNILIEWKKKKILNFQNSSKPNRKIVKKKAKSITLAQKIQDSTFTWHGTGTSIKTIGVKLVLGAKFPPLSKMIRPYKYFPHISKLPPLTYKRTL